jgi:hypothetical protein
MPVALARIFVQGKGETRTWLPQLSTSPSKTFAPNWA